VINDRQEFIEDGFTGAAGLFLPVAKYTFAIVIEVCLESKQLVLEGGNFLIARVCGLLHFCRRGFACRVGVWFL